MQKTYQFYADPGHGWLKVPHKALYELGIQEQISQYSYERGNFAYLEEDCDLSLFFKAFRARFGTDPVVHASEGNKQSKIRSYSRYIKPSAACLQTPAPF